MEQLRLTLPELEQEEQGIRENLGGIVRILSGLAGICPGLTGQEPIN